nr:F-box/kelch-repeat protein At1g57790-like [Ipomoea batatas]
MTKSNKSISGPPTPSHFPLLVYFHGKKSNTQTFYDIERDNYEVKKIPDMFNKYVGKSSHGWSVMIDVNMRSGTCFLLNIASLEKIKLPPWKFRTPMFSILTLPPSDPKSIVAFFRPGISSVMFCHLDEKVWTEWELDDDDDDYDYESVISCEGKIYCFTLKKMKVLDAEMRQSRVEKIKLPEWEVPGAMFFTRYFIESLGEIFVVIIIHYSWSMFKIRDVFVYKLDFEKAKWIRVNNLGVKRVFFISGETTSMSCSSIGSSGRVKENSIYIIPPFSNENEEMSFSNENEKMSIYIYDMEEKTITTQKFCSNVVYNVSAGQWIM